MVPALRAALICESVLTELDGLHSAIRIFHRLHLAPGELFEARLLLMLATTAPSADEQHKILVRVETRDAQVVSGIELAITTPREAGETFSAVIPFQFEAPAIEDMFWLRFAYDTEDQVLTRVPVHFRPLSAPPGS